MSVTFRVGAENLRVPILMITRRARLPGPRMQLVEGRDAVAIRLRDEVESLTEQLRRLGIDGVPRGLEGDVLDTDELERSLSPVPTL